MFLNPIQIRRKIWGGKESTLEEALHFCIHEAPLPFHLFSRAEPQPVARYFRALSRERESGTTSVLSDLAGSAGGGGVTGGGCRRCPSSWAGGRWGVSTPRRRAPTGACCRGPRGWSPVCGWCPQCRCSPPSGRRSARTPAAGGHSPSPASPGSRPRRA